MSTLVGRVSVTESPSSSSTSSSIFEIRGASRPGDLELEVGAVDTGTATGGWGLKVIEEGEEEKEDDGDDMVIDGRLELVICVLVDVLLS